MYEGRDRRREIFSAAFHLIFWDKVSHWPWSLSSLAGSYGWKLLVSTFPASQTHAIMSLLCYILLSFMQVLEVWTQFSCLHSKHFTYWAISPAPISLAWEENLCISIVWSIRQCFSVWKVFTCAIMLTVTSFWVLEPIGCVCRNVT